MFNGYPDKFTPHPGSNTDHNVAALTISNTLVEALEGGGGCCSPVKNVTLYVFYCLNSSSLKSVAF